MAYIRQRKGRWTVEIRHRRGQQIYKTFIKKSDALRFINETETLIQTNRYRNISEASKTTLKIVIQRYVREIIKYKADEKRAEKFRRDIQPQFDDDVGKGVGTLFTIKKKDFSNV